MNCNCYPHNPWDLCTCSGCWACDGFIQGCTCDIDWDCTYLNPCQTRAKGIRTVELQGDLL